MKVYITDYALTMGIFCIEVTRVPNSLVWQQVIERPENQLVLSPWRLFDCGQLPLTKVKGL